VLLNEKSKDKYINRETASAVVESLTPRVIRQQTMVMSPTALGTKNNRASEGQQQFVPADDSFNT
jgi:hypothetical protein